MATSLPVVTVTPADGYCTGTCESCGWTFRHVGRPVVDLEAANHRRSHQTWKGPR